MATFWALIGFLWPIVLGAVAGRLIVAAYRSSRGCQYCGDRLRFWGRLLRFSTCVHCASRMQMGYPPRRRPQ